MKTINVNDIQKIIKASLITDTKLGKKTTAVCLTLPNGFEIVATSSCVLEETYDHELGKKLCLKKIEDRLWELEGYLLHQQIFEKTPIIKYKHEFSIEYGSMSKSGFENCFAKVNTFLYVCQSAGFKCTSVSQTPGITEITIISSEDITKVISSELGITPKVTQLTKNSDDLHQVLQHFYRAQTAASCNKKDTLIKELNNAAILAERILQ
jgi:hypothetical protein